MNLLKVFHLEVENLSEGPWVSHAIIVLYVYGMYVCDVCMCAHICLHTLFVWLYAFVCVLTLVHVCVCVYVHV